jgi:predicted DNA-binding transcriptional regulator YafY
MDGYRLPPIMFTKEEAIAFLTAEKLVEKLTDPSTYQIYRSALFKIKAVLKNDDKEHIEKMDNYIEVVKNPYLPKNKDTNDHIQTILQSIFKKNILSINYFANHDQKKTTRDIEPVGIFLMSNQWYLIAFCLLRNDYRNFRIDRILTSKQTERSFKNDHPPLKNYLNEITKEKNGLHKVIIRLDNSILKHIGEQKFYNGFVSEKTGNNKTEMIFLTASTEGFARWYMMFGDHAEIISPISLKNRVKEITASLTKNLN